ncbi:class IIb bacteriocin, lactobin A/cerein 7B family [Flavobacterium sp.]|nr:class IIb bacteriocin, lactobin A/cerein 7B family [Flavobacterium sp.]
MNLEDLNLVELNAQEVQEVDGGFIPLPWLVAGAVIGGVFGLGFYNGYNS